MPTESKAPRHDGIGLQGLTADAQANRLAANLLRVETATYLCYEMICHQNKVEPLAIDQFLARAEARDALWRDLCAREDFKENERIKAARLITQEYGPKFQLDAILHRASIMQHNGSVIKDPGAVMCPACHKPKDWDKWCKDQWVETKTPTFDKEKLKADIERMFGPGPTVEHGTLYCFRETNVIPEYQWKSPKFPRFVETTRGPCMEQLLANYWRWIPRVR